MGKKMGRKNYTTEYAKQFFEDNGCELLEKKYVNSKTKMRYRCNCGNIGYISFNNFQRGRRCKECGIRKMAESQRHTFEFIKQFFEDNGCELLEIKYINALTKMRYICNCGEESKICFASFQQGKRCKKCGIKKMSEYRTFTFECVKQFFEDNGCVLLETEYINSQTKMKYICICGRTHRISFVKFKQGQRCKKCAIERNSGKKNYNYNPNLTDEDRADRRMDKRVPKWRKNVYKNNGYTCQKCIVKGGILNAHHMDSWGSCEEKRYNEDNGITFCINCHHDFHKKYGYGYNTKEQVEEFLGRVLGNKK